MNITQLNLHGNAIASILLVNNKLVLVQHTITNAVSVVEEGFLL